LQSKKLESWQSEPDLAKLAQDASQRRISISAEEVGYMRKLGARVPLVMDAKQNPEKPRTGGDSRLFHEFVSGAEAVQQLLAARSSSSGVPVLCGTAEDVADLESGNEEVESSEETILADAFKLDIEKWFADKAEKDAENYLGYADAVSLAADLHCESTDELTMHLDKGRPMSQVALARIPVAEPWMVPAYLGYGGWNACPDASVHVALCKKWHEQYGAVLACIKGNVMEFTVDRPPKSEAQSLLLATEQFLYCPDIVYQGGGSVATLARLLEGRRHWFFWWD